MLQVNLTAQSLPGGTECLSQLPQEQIQPQGSSWLDPGAGWGRQGPSLICGLFPASCIH